MDLQEITNYLRANKIYIPLYKPICRSYLGEAASTIDSVDKIDISNYADGIARFIHVIQKENEDLKKTLRDMAEDDYRIHWYRDSKVEILEKYFPDLIEKLPYYAGGKLKGKE